MLLLTAVVAVWTSYWHSVQVIHKLESQIASMQRLAHKLLIHDRQQIAVVQLPQTWHDENRWKVYLPVGEYRIGLATRQIDNLGLAPVRSETLIGEGTHEIELLQSDDEDGSVITVTVDGRPMIEATESQDWNPKRSSTGGGNFFSSAQLSPDDPIVLLRRRYGRRSQTSQRPDPQGPTEGLLLWIERIPLILRNHPKPARDSSDA